MSSLAVRISLVAALPVILFAVGIVAWLRSWPLGVDSSVYRDGAVLFLHRQSLYSVGTLGYHHLPFTYPPAAALLFVPLVALPGQLAWALMATASLLGLALVIRLAIARVPCWRFPPMLSTVLLTAVMVCLVPVWSNLGLGQINILLMAMVTTDVLLVTYRGSRWGGVLIGLAAAVKLVPLIFIPYLFITGKRAAAARAAAVFVGLQGLMAVIAPQDSGFWTSYMFHTGRIGPTQFSDNQSLAGLMERVTAMSPWYADAAWAVGAVIAVPALLLVLRYHRRGQEVSALCVTAGFGLLLSPVTWVAGWVWVAPVVVAQLSWLQASWHASERRPAVVRRRAVLRERWSRVGLVIAVIAVFTINFSISPQRRQVLGWFWFFVLSNPYVVTAIGVVLVLSACALRRRVQRGDESGGLGSLPVMD